jgi:PAS domain S-box-containing protein
MEETMVRVPSHTASWTAARIAATYAALGALWILLSDRLLAEFTRDPATLTTIQTAKGWLFVAMSALVLYMLVRPAMQRVLRARAEQARDRQALAAVLDQVTDAVIGCDAEGTLTVVNRTAREWSGSGKTPASVVEWAESIGLGEAETEDVLPLHRIPAMRALRGEDVRQEALVVRGAEPVRHVVASARPVRNAAGDTVGAVVSLHDVTHQRDALAQLRESEERFRAVFEGAGVGMALVAMDQRIFDANEALARILGYRRDELIGKTVADVSHPDDMPLDLERKRRMVEEGRSAGTVVKRYVRSDGAVIWGRLTVSLVRGPDGAPRFVVDMVEDVTQQRAAEDALRASEARARAVLEAIPDAMFRIRWDGTYLEFLPAERFATFVPPAQFLGKTLAETLPADVAQRALQQLHHALETGSLQTLSYSLSMDDGPRHYEARIVPVGEDEVLALVRDVTGEQQAQLRLAESEERLKLAVAAGRHGLYDLDLRTGDAVVNEDYCRMLGYEPDELQETNARWRERLHPDDRAAAERMYADYMSGRRSDYKVEFRQRTKDDRWKWILSTGTIVDRDSAGAPLRMLGTHTDIDEAKRREEALRHANRALALRAETNRLIAQARSEEELLQGICELATDLAGYRLAWVGVPLDTPDRQVEAVASAGPARAYLDDLRVSWGDGEYGQGPTGTCIRTAQVQLARDLASQARYEPWRARAGEHGLAASVAIPLRDESATIGALNVFSAEVGAFDAGEVGLLEDLGRDVALGVRGLRARQERDRAIEALTRSETRYRMIVETAEEGILTIDADAHVTFTNARMARMLGHDTTDLRGRSLFEFMDEAGRRLAEQHLERRRAGLREQFDFRFRHRDGHDVWAVVTATPLVGGDGRYAGSLSMVTDITERKRVEQELERSREELRWLAAAVENGRESERARVARELHDELGQALTGLKMDVAWLRGRVASVDAEAEARAGGTLKLIDVTVDAVRRISAELRPGVLDDLGLNAAVRWQAREFTRRTGVAVRLEGVDVIPAWRDARGTAVFRIFQEALTNVARHAQARDVLVRSRSAGGELLLDIHDDGRGFSVTAGGARRHLGLIGMEERARTIGGRIAITSDTGRGTTVTLTVPLDRPATAGAR